MRRSIIRRTRLLLLAAAVPALTAAACETVDLGMPPADVNACRPSQDYFIGNTVDGGTRGDLWNNIFTKDYAGRRCVDSTCHGDAANNSFKLTTPPAGTCLPPNMPACPIPLPLMGVWANNYRVAAEQMNCANVMASRLYTMPTALTNHGGQKLFDQTDPEALLIINWVGAVP